MRIKIFGPPGTGKTTTLHKIMDYALGYSQEPPFTLPESFPTDLKADNIAFVSFTNTAIDVMGKRTGITPRSKEAPYMRTIHGLILSVLNDKFDPEAISKLKDLLDIQANFSKRMGYYFSKDPYEFAEGNQKFNTITKAIQLYLPKTGDLVEALKLIDDTQDRKFALEWLRFKEKHKVMDFDDILVTGFEYLGEFFVPVEVAFIDEGQDNGPLDYLLLEHGFKGAEFIFLAGDPLQSIYGFKGARPELFIKWKAHKELTLNRSYRNPKRVWLLSQAWALNLGVNPRIINYTPAPKEGLVTRMHLQDALKYAVEQAKKGRTVLILARTNSLVRLIGNMLSIEFGVAYGHLKRPSYWETHLLKFIEGLQMLKLWDGVTPIKVTSTRPITGLLQKVGNLQAREVLKKWRQTRTWTLEVQSTLLKIKKNPNEYLHLTDFDKEALKAYFTKACLNLTETLILDTIHAAKGEEADIVIFLDFLLSQSEERINPLSLEERLVAYVGFTRASEELIIVPTPQIKYHPMIPYVGEVRLKSIVTRWKPKALAILGGE